MRLIIYGTNTINEAILSGAVKDRVFVSEKKQKSGLIDKGLLELLKKNGIGVYPKKDEAFISEFGKEAFVKGIAGVADYREYGYEDILALPKHDSPPFYLILDGITDPRNFGAIIRTGNCAGLSGIIIPKNNSIGITSAAANVSQGALFYTPVAAVVNIARVIDDLKKRGVWVVGLSNEGNEDIYSMDFTVPLSLVVGSEGRGLRRLTSSKCEKILKIPMMGNVNSLNASASFAVCAYEILRQRLSR